MTAALLCLWPISNHKQKNM